MMSMHAGAVERLPLLDLSHATSADDLGHITSIASVALVVVPEHLMTPLSHIPMRDVANIVGVPKGANVRIHTGSLLLGGDGLADPGGDDEVLVVTGGLVVTSPVQHVGFRQVLVTGMVLAPRGSESALGAGLTRVTGAVLRYTWAENQEFRLLTGDVRLSGESLANRDGSPDDILVATGNVIVTGEVPAVGYQQVIAMGQLLAPKDGEPQLARALTVQGEVAWYSGTPRFFVGDETFGHDFFELLDGAHDLALVGDMTIADDVTPELLRAKVSNITLMGSITARRGLIGAVQVLTTEKCGEILVGGEGGAEHR